MKQNYNIDFIYLIHSNPLLSKILKYIVFWIASYSLLMFIAHQNLLAMYSVIGQKLEINQGLPVGDPPVKFTVLIGVIFGTSLALLDHLLTKIYHRNHSLGLNILAGGLIYFCLLAGLVIAIRSASEVFSNYFIEKNSLSAIILEESGERIEYILLIYTFLMTLVISFFNQIASKFGPGYLWYMILGTFRFPREQERVFMFLDLNSSTRLAEELGHLKYSSLIQHSFLDINRIVREYHAEIYQYVGDEIVISWPLQKFQGNSPIGFLFSVQDQLNSREDFYYKQFGEVPTFKAGIHMGMVSVIEVGDVKRELAYHGDTLNVASRLENLCKSYDSSLLISGEVKNSIQDQNRYHTTFLGQKNLEGRESPLEVFSVRRHTNKYKNLDK
ncbi:adenylate cyclase [Gillisia mitskevichiae]|uniref:Adenylate cyclase n=1 Tax=Gillisia mitskevichiae TaxID=270921 RepID=A0A495PLC5_9FLAO|nr:adenylate/guanylate cyclase domain-containing protein [Gillisia mitskevichiae]RKS50495.1 adenylate cyclase [Gillisia mitskevichiae]